MFLLSFKIVTVNWGFFPPFSGNPHMNSVKRDNRKWQWALKLFFASFIFSSRHFFRTSFFAENLVLWKGTNPYDLEGIKSYSVLSLEANPHRAYFQHPTTTTSLFPCPSLPLSLFSPSLSSSFLLSESSTKAHFIVYGSWCFWEWTVLSWPPRL